MKAKKPRKRSPLSFINKRNDASKSGVKRKICCGIDVVEAVNLTYGNPEDIANCTCPICAELAMEGKVQRVVDADGEIYELRQEAPEMIEITLLLSPRLAVHTHCEKRELSIPAGCNMMDMLEFLRYKYPSVRREFGPLSLSGEIEGQLSAPDFVLQPGQVVSVDGQLDSEMSAMMSPLFF